MEPYVCICPYFLCIHVCWVQTVMMKWVYRFWWWQEWQAFRVLIWFCSPEDIWWCLQTVLIVTPELGLLPDIPKQRLGMFPNMLHSCDKDSSSTVSLVTRLKTVSVPERQRGWPLLTEQMLIGCSKYARLYLSRGLDISIIQTFIIVLWVYFSVVRACDRQGPKRTYLYTQNVIKLRSYLQRNVC